jgi:hypothetical protein
VVENKKKIQNEEEEGLDIKVTGREEEREQRRGEEIAEDKLQKRGGHERFRWGDGDRERQ